MSALPLDYLESLPYRLAWLSSRLDLNISIKLQKQIWLTCCKSESLTLSASICRYWDPINDGGFNRVLGAVCCAF